MERRQFLRGLVAGAGVLGAFTVGYGVREYTTDAPSREPEPLRTAPNSTERSDVRPASATYVVSPDGDDSNAGTADSPFRSVERAVADVQPGETVFLREGTYRRDSSVDVRGVHGEPEERIVLAAHPDRRATFRFDGPVPGGWDSDGGLRFADVSHLSVRNVDVRNSPAFGLALTDGSTNTLVENVRAYNNNLAGLGIYQGSSNNVVRNVASANNYDPQNDGQNADGIIVARSRDNAVLNGWFYYNSDDGVDLWSSTGITVRRCVSWNNGRDEGDGNGFKLGGDGESGDHDVVRNVAYHNRAIGFDYNSADVPMRVYHNTAWRNRYNFSFYDADHRIANNISHEGDLDIGQAVTTDHNTWGLGIENPEFASYNPAGDRYLHLASTSPCIDAGTPLDGEFAVANPDLGAYEYDGSAES